MNELSLFTGIGGGLLGTKLLGWSSVGYVEINSYCQRVLQQRIKDGILDDAPIFGDIREFNRTYAEEFKGVCDIITAGFPCQPFSVAGKRQGADDERNMWPATIECIRTVRPRYALLENVPGLLTSGYFGTILRDLSKSGYDCRWRCLSAAEVGANHKRNRLWIMAYSTRNQHSGNSRAIQRSDEQTQKERQERRIPELRNASEGKDVADTRCGGSGKIQSKQFSECNKSPDVSESGQDVADSANSRTQGMRKRENQTVEDASNATASGLQKPGSANIGKLQKEDRKGVDNRPAIGSWWSVEPDLGRLAHGIPNRVDRLRAIGNAQVPGVVKAVWGLLND